MDITSLKKIRTLYTWMVNFFKELYSRIKNYSEHYARETVYLSILFILLLLAIYVFNYDIKPIISFWKTVLQQVR